MPPPSKIKLKVSKVIFNCLSNKNYINHYTTASARAGHAPSFLKLLCSVLERGPSARSFCSCSFFNRSVLVSFCLVQFHSEQRTVLPFHSVLFFSKISVLFRSFSNHSNIFHGFVISFRTMGSFFIVLFVLMKERSFPGTTLPSACLIQSGFSHVFGVYSKPIEIAWQYPLSIYLSHHPMRDGSLCRGKTLN